MLRTILETGHARKMEYARKVFIKKGHHVRLARRIAQNVSLKVLA